MIGGSISPSQAIDIAKEAGLDAIIDNGFVYLIASHGKDPWRINFVELCQAARLRRIDFKKELLLRACRTPSNRVIDATAGMGRDSLLLAQAGFNVLMLERSPLLAFMLQQALDELARVDSTLAERLQCLPVDATDYFKQLSPDDYPPVIYCDPMHPERQKSALVKKDLRIIRDIVGADMDAEQLIAAAKDCATEKLVVKWPQGAAGISGVMPTYTLKGGRMRYDVIARS
jgi:16S rRNA (guanine1516-N2)-methyltransferase